MVRADSPGPHGEPREEETRGEVWAPLPVGVCPDADDGKQGSPRRMYDITTSYRDTYGGNRGTDMDGWRSASSSPVKAPRLGEARSDTEEAEPGAWTSSATAATTMPTSPTTTATAMGQVASDKHNPLEDIAVLTTGQVLRHRDAMESLVGVLKACSLDSSRENDELLATSSLIATNGGTHLMTVNLVESSDRAMRDLCAEGLVEMFLREPSALQEVVSSRETVSKLLGMSVREILGGQGSKKATASPSASPAYRRLFNVLVESPSEHVTKSCAEHKIVHKLVERLKHSGASPGRAAVNGDTMTVLSTLQTMIGTGNEYYASSFVWNGALDVVLPMLAVGDDLGNDRRVAIARLVASVCVGRQEDRDVVEAWVCTVEAVKGLSLLLADEDVTTDVQILVARVLLVVSSVHAGRQDVLDAMVDFCLPRACEIIIDADEDGDGDEDELVAIAAAISANLAKDSALAMEVLIFHANVLRRVVNVLVGVKSYDAGKELLRAAGLFCLGGDRSMAVVTE